MKKKKIYKSKALEIIHKTIVDMFKSGSVKADIMREFDKSCLVMWGNG